MLKGIAQRADALNLHFHGIPGAQVGSGTHADARGRARNDEVAGFQGHPLRQKRKDARDRLFLRVLIGGLCLTTLVIVASAIHRMSLYEKAYGFSVERLLVRWIELGMAIVLVLILVAGIRMSARWLPTAVVAVGAFGMLGLAIFNPESYIAQRNVEFFEQTGKIDQWYMGTLSSDAFAATKSLPEEVRVCVQGRMKEHLRPTAPWYEYNVSRAQVRDAEVKETSCNVDYDHR